MKPRQILNIIGLIYVLVVNTLANLLPLNNITTAEISDKIPSLFTPAGYVFSIWGLIYLLLIGFTIFQALPSQKDNPILERIGLWFFISCLFNGSWIFMWHYGLYGLSVVMMLGLLISLLGVYLRANIGKSQPRLIERLMIDIPFGVYLGWISVATIANIASLLIVIGWGGFGLLPVFWTVVVLIVGLLLGLAMIALRHEIAYPLVLIWAFFGIIQAQSENTPIVVAAGIASAILVVALLFLIFKIKLVKSA